MKVVVTGGLGFIGSNLIEFLFENDEVEILCIDKLTYAGCESFLNEIRKNPKLNYLNVDICEKNLVFQEFKKFQPDLVINLAAESHVDRSISSPYDFIETNVVGTMALLEASRAYYDGLSDERKTGFRFLQVSTDEVFGDLAHDEPSFNEESLYKPSSPYSASKAGSDHLVMAWSRTYDLPTLLTNCSNNYGRRQNTEKLIPSVISSALTFEPITVYGDGTQIRDWLHVDDHVRALYTVATKGKVGARYNIGGGAEITNIDLVIKICNILETMRPLGGKREGKYTDLIEFVEDRPGHDLRYAINNSRINKELGWYPKESLDSGLRKTVQWYCENINVF